MTYDLDEPLRLWTRQQLEDYLHDRGFAVYEDESREKIEEAVRLDIIKTTCSGGEEEEDGD